MVFMTSSDLPPEAPATVPPVTATPATRVRWPSQQQVLGLVGAFVLGACLCGGAGLAIGAIAGSHHSNHGPGLDRRDDFPRRGGDDERRRDGNFRRPPILPPNRPAPPTAPVVPVPPAPTSTPS